MSVDCEALHNTIRSRVKTLLEVGESVTVLYDNAPGTIPDNETWIRASIRLGETQQATRGGATKLFRTSGVLYVQIFSPGETGDKDALELATTVVQSFRSLTAAGVTYESPSVKTVGRSGASWQINVECPFYADGFAS